MWIRTVYKAGSVIPKIADILAEVLIVLFSLFLVLKIIAATAPNWPIVDIIIVGSKKSPPRSAKFWKITGVNAWCIPVITNNGLMNDKINPPIKRLNVNSPPTQYEISTPT